MQVFIHSGMHKTGTSSFQTALRDNSERLLADRTRAFTPADRMPVEQMGFPKDYVAEMISTAAAEGTKKLIISLEAISLFSPEGLSRLRAEIGPNPARFIVVFRHWCNYLPSRWIQNCKRRDSASFFRFMERTGSNEPWMRFDRILTDALRAGFDEVVPISFEGSRGTLLEELCKACEIDISPENLTANKSPAVAAVEKVRLFNAVRSANSNLPMDELLTRLTDGRQVKDFFDQGATVSQVLEMMPSLDMALDRKIDESRAEMVLVPERFSPLNHQLEEAAGKVLFSDIEPHRGFYSTLEFDDLEEDLVAEMRLGLRRVTPGFLSNVRRKLRARF